MGRTKNPNSLQFTRRDLFQTLIVGSVTGAALQAASTQTPEPRDGMARCAATEIRTKYGSFVAENLALNLQDYTLNGSVTNRTNRPWRWVTFAVDMRDPAGQSIRHDDQFDATFYVKAIREGESQPVVSADGKTPRLLLHASSRPASIAVKFVPERSYADSRAEFSLVHPVASADLTFQDDRLKIAFNVTTTELQFNLTNRLSERVTIDWEKATYVDLWGGKHRVIHGGIKLGQKDKPQPPTRLDAGSSVDEMVYPADLVAGSRVFEDWRLNPLLPLSQDAPDYHLHSFGLLLPVATSNSTKLYRFTIRIDKVLTV